jgi:hypothetical protein
MQQWDCAWVRQEAELRVGARPVSRSEKQSAAVGLLLHPREPDRLIFESPSRDQGQRLGQHRPDRPEKENGVVRRELRDRQVHDLPDRIGAVERRAPLPLFRPGLESPWRIGENRVEFLAGNSEIVEVFYPAAILGARGVRAHPACALAHLQDAARDALDLGAGADLDLRQQPLEFLFRQFGEALRARRKMLVDAEIAQQHAL